MPTASGASSRPGTAKSQAGAGSSGRPVTAGRSRPAAGGGGGGGVGRAGAASGGVDPLAASSSAGSGGDAGGCRVVCKLQLNHETTAPGGLGGRGAQYSLQSSIGLLNRTAEQDRQADYNLQKLLVQALREVSRQKLRSFLTALRTAATSEGELSKADLQRLVGQLKLPVSERLQNLLAQTCGVDDDDDVIDFERLADCLRLAHRMTRRDSVDAAQESEVTTTELLREDDRDQELVMRAVEHFLTHSVYFDTPALKADLQLRDSDKRGRVTKSEILESCAKHDCPVYGAVFNSLLKRCDAERNDIISWPEFVSFLERAQEIFFEHVPEAPRMAPEKQNTPTTARIEMQSKLKNLAWKARNMDSVKEEPLVSSRQTAAAQRLLPKRKEEALKAAAAHKAASSLLASSGDVIRVTSPNAATDGAAGAAAASKGEDAGRPEANGDGGSKGGKLALLRGMKKMKALEVFFRAASSAKMVATAASSPSSTAGSRHQSPSPSPSRRGGGVSPSRRPTSAVRNPVSSGFVVDGTVAATAAAGSMSPLLAPPQPSRRGAPPPGSVTSRVRGLERMALCPTGFDLAGVSADLPHQRLQLDWVYGYRGNDCRSNIHILQTQEIIYFTGHLVVILNPIENQQRHYREHSADVKSIAVHADGVTVATGQGQGVRKSNETPCIRIWRSDTLETLGILGPGLFHGAIVGLAFCKPMFQLPAESDTSLESLRVMKLLIDGEDGSLRKTFCFL